MKHGGKHMDLSKLIGLFFGASMVIGEIWQTLSRLYPFGKKPRIIQTGAFKVRKVGLDSLEVG